MSFERSEYGRPTRCLACQGQAFHGPPGGPYTCSGCGQKDSVQVKNPVAGSRGGA